jgi:monofunctional biosynthetic peptidoglycan transglycosylase
LTRGLRRIGRAAILLSLGALLGSVLLVAPLRWLDPPTSAFMLGKRIDALLEGDFAYRNRHQWVDSAAISTHLPRALIAAEDQRFFDHHGFDIDAIRKAVDSNRKGRRVRGASTISQQTAKNLFLWSTRSWVRKGLESWFTIWIELLWPKSRILEIYMNIAEFGPGIYGAEAAARTLFGRSAATLNREQAALLAAVLPSPRRYRADAPSPWLQRRANWILGQMRQIRLPD